MPNPNPSPKDRYQVKGSEPLAKRTLGVRVRESLDQAVRELPGDLSARLRRWIEEGYLRDKAKMEQEKDSDIRDNKE